MSGVLSAIPHSFKAGSRLPPRSSSSPTSATPRHFPLARRDSAGDAAQNPKTDGTDMASRIRALWSCFVLLTVVFASPVRADAGWGFYGGDAGGTRYSEAAQITPANVDDLIPAWSYQTGDSRRRPSEAFSRSSLENTPVLANGRLLLCTPFNEVIALDPGTGAELWRFDPGIAMDVRYGNGYTCRGVSAWTDAAASPDEVCAQRVFVATNDARLIALDQRSGRLCGHFGSNGIVSAKSETDLLWSGEFQITSPPVIVSSVIIVGSSISDNARVDAPRGTVRAFDVRTGEPRWLWDPVPRNPADPATSSWGDAWQNVGHANVWAPMSADERRGLVFLPTSSASPDFFGGLRPGANAHANSIVALKAESGEIAWAYQTVHHDVWDYDVPAQPTLATLDLDDGKRDVVIQGTKMGFVFVLDRDTGQPVFPVEERPVPQDGVAGEVLSPTQPIPVHVPPLVPQRIDANEAFGFTPWDRGACRDLMAKARSEGLYTPPSLQGTLLFPFTGGGVNWGGVALDPRRQVLYANTSRLVHLVTLFPAADFADWERRYPDEEVSPQRGAPFGMKRVYLRSPLGLPCNPPPWGTLAAIDLKAGRILWESTLGTTESLAPLGLALHTGTPSFGGPLVTAGGVVFIGATLDRYLRAFDAASGKELWQGRLPAPAIATPLTYEWEGRQFVLVAAGGRREVGVDLSDTFQAFALPPPGARGPTLLSRTFDRPGGRFWTNVSLIVLALTVIALGVRWLWRQAKTASNI